MFILCLFLSKRAPGFQFVRGCRKEVCVPRLSLQVSVVVGLSSDQGGVSVCGQRLRRESALCLFFSLRWNADAMAWARAAMLGREAFAEHGRAAREKEPWVSDNFMKHPTALASRSAHLRTSLTGQKNRFHLFKDSFFCPLLLNQHGPLLSLPCGCLCKMKKQPQRGGVNHPRSPSNSYINISLLSCVK